MKRTEGHAGALLPIIGVVAACLIGGMLAAVSITDESVVGMNGDMPKYLMNGAFFYDYVRDLFGGRASFNVFEYATLYFAQYPALSLGHHPILLGITLVPFYAIFGISVFAARIHMMVMLLVAIVAMYLMTRKLYNETVAALAALIFATTPFIVVYARIVMSELPTITLMLLSAYWFLRYCDTDRPVDAYLTSLWFVIGLYSKHLAIFLAPAILVVLVQKKGLRALWRKEVIISVIVSGLLIIPLAIITLKFSHVNVEWVAQAPLEKRVSSSNLLFYLRMIWTDHLTPPILMLSGLGILFSAIRRDIRALFPALWILCCYLFLTALGIQKNARYAIFWIPAFCVFAASVIEFVKQRWWLVTVSALTIASVGYQAWLAAEIVPEYTKGYEQAAQYIAAHPKDGSILYSGAIDTSYFIFYARKYDPTRQLIILRSDKIFATSKLNRIVADRIASKDEMYQLLQQYGVRYVVVEDTPSTSPALEWLREDVHSERFLQHVEIPLHTDFTRLKHVNVSVYEYKDAHSINPEQTINMEIPLMGESLQVKFGMLLKKSPGE